MTFPNLRITQFPVVVVRPLLPLTMLTCVVVVGAVLSSVYGLIPAEERLRTAEQAFQSAKQAQADLQRTQA